MLLLVAVLAALFWSFLRGREELQRERAREEVVEVLVRPGESVESGQPMLRIARFDRLLVRADLPAGEAATTSGTTARIVVVGLEDRSIRGTRVALASSTDPKTLG